MEPSTQSRHNTQETPLHYIALLFLFLTTFFVYSPGLQGGFLLDDQGTITSNQNLNISSLNISNLYQAALSSDAGPLKRPVSMLSFAIDNHIHGANPYYFKLTNLLIHLLNGLIIFILTRLLIDAYLKSKNQIINKNRAYWVGFFTTAAWLLHPLNLTSVLYVSQRMNSLSALFTFAGLALYIYGRSKAKTRCSSALIIVSAFIICWPLASLSKENGALLPLFLLIIEATIFRFKNHTPSALLSLKTIYLLTVALPAIILIGFIALNPEWLSRGYIGRDFSLYERVLTQCRALWFYIGLSFFPRNSTMGIYHDDFQVSEGLLNPITTIFSIAGLAIAITVAIWLRKKSPLVTFGVLFFFAGHIIESSIFPLELIYEHRNYVPVYGILVVIFYFLINPEHIKKHHKAINIIAVSAISFFAIVTYERASYWGNPFLHHLSEVKNHPQSARANYEIGVIYAGLVPKNKGDINNNYKTARKYFEIATEVDKNCTAGLFGLITLNYSVKKPPEERWISSLKDRLKNTPTRSSRINSLNLLAKCNKEIPCMLPNSTITDIFGSALENPTLARHKRAAVLSIMANYYGNQLNNPSMVLKLVIEAKNEVPKHPHYRLNLARVLIALNKYNEAEKELFEANSLDLTGRHKKIIRNLKNLIEKHRNTTLTPNN